ncbi:hypothetical protein [Saccharopolyspora elongata]|uniref:Uncharacterized protein n=1 Tax=Saccharopolyspora elongata TaxID=2530387 RepID=A0A4V2YLT8_9PSEU|nr:hypothetical protein [Saccharopolyspora elongata]TDD47947.1 hypothetical protein E1288_23650 [Saccharopolyspora elongata]
MPRNNLRTCTLFQEFSSLAFPGQDYAIFGSGPLFAWGIRSHISDLDVIARGEAWEMATTLGTPSPAPSGYGDMVQLSGGRIEIFDRWIDAAWDTDTLIDNAEYIDGLKFVTMAMVVQWKGGSSREKDKRDMDLIYRYYGRRF